MALYLYEYFLLFFILMSYKVVSGDTLIKIAKKFGTTYQELAKINCISDPDKIQVGQILKIPNTTTSSSSSSSSYKTYTISSGDTLSKIAKRFGTTYQEIARINGISNPDIINVGQVIKIPYSGSFSPSNNLTSNSASTFNTYTIVSGDTLSQIANRFGTTYQELARINGISNPNIIQVGQKIKIPGSVSSTSNLSSNTSSTFNNYTIVSGDTLSKIAKRFGTTYQELARINGISNPNIIHVGQVIKVPNSNSFYNPIPQPINKPTSNPQSHPPNNNNNQIIVQTSNTKVLEALKKSPWSSKADSLSVAYYVLKNNGYSNECAIGLMANLVAEGNYGIVEYSFSKSHNFGFYLPSGGVKCKTIADINYVKNWTTSNEGSGNSKLKKGSCGFGSVQWSFERRVNFANICLSIMKEDSDVHDGNWSIAEATFITQELKGGYYNSVKNAAINAGGSVEAWAEAFTDKYERPSGADLKMTGVGTACKTRRKYAREIYDYLNNLNALD